MNPIRTHQSNSGIRALVALTVGCLIHATGVEAATLANAPLFVKASQPPLVMLTMARDHKLYYEAYNDYSDLNGDGSLDVGYKPGVIEYYGHFDSYKCYSYSGGLFTPVAMSDALGTTPETYNKKCTGSGRDTYWSGDFLNYVTTSRIDALRKVLYGGFRSTDTTTQTIVERAFIPQDAHSWGKEYHSVANDGYDISEYTPLALPADGQAPSVRQCHPDRIRAAPPDARSRQQQLQDLELGFDRTPGRRNPVRDRKQRAEQLRKRCRQLHGHSGRCRCVSGAD